MGYLWVNVLTALLRRFVPCSDVQNEYSPLYHRLYRIIRMIFLCPRQFLYIPAYAMIFHSITSHNIPLYPIPVASPSYPHCIHQFGAPHHQPWRVESPLCSESCWAWTRPRWRLGKPFGISRCLGCNHVMYNII